MDRPQTFVKGMADCAACGKRIIFNVRRDMPPDLGFGHGHPVYCLECDPIFPPFMPDEVIEISVDGLTVELAVELNTGNQPRSHAIYEWFFEL